MRRMALAREEICLVTDIPQKLKKPRENMFNTTQSKSMPLPKTALTAPVKSSIYPLGLQPSLVGSQEMWLATAITTAV